jgi:hypothetical protein
MKELLHRGDSEDEAGSEEGERSEGGDDSLFKLVKETSAKKKKRRKVNFIVTLAGAGHDYVPSRWSSLMMTDRGDKEKYVPQRPRRLKPRRGREVALLLLRHSRAAWQLPSPLSTLCSILLSPPTLTSPPSTLSTITLALSFPPPSPSASICPPSHSPLSQNLVSCLSSITPTATPSSSALRCLENCAWPSPIRALSQLRLVSLLTQHGYTETSTPMLFRHHTHSTAFTLTIDDFLIRYSHPSELDHLVSCLSTLYELKFHRDLPHYTYLGYTIDYSSTSPSPCMTFSMPNYVPAMLSRLCSSGCGSASSPAIYTPPVSYPDPPPHLSPPFPTSLSTTWIQQVVGSLLFYARVLACLS